MITLADARRLPLADGVAHCCVTSPPYFGLRDYGVAGQLGLEATPAEYIAEMVAVFREVRRVLRDDGTCWINLGDSYVRDAGNGIGGTSPLSGSRHNQNESGRAMKASALRNGSRLEAKQLLGMPWRVAFALQADGWWLRSDIIWSKPNPMPESVTDRPTKAHEYVFLLAKSERYFYDADAIREPYNVAALDRYAYAFQGSTSPGRRQPGNRDERYKQQRDGEPNDLGRNRRTVWTIATEPCPDAHFATMPTALVKPCILAGSPLGGLVLDPFLGSGTVGRVAEDLGRRWVGCDLSAPYTAIARRRTAQLGLLARTA